MTTGSSYSAHQLGLLSHIATLTTHVNGPGTVCPNIDVSFQLLLNSFAVLGWATALSSQS